MKSKALHWIVRIHFIFFTLPLLYSQPPWEVQVAEALEQMAGRYYKPVVTTAMGTFSFEYTGLGSSFSRYLEEKLVNIISGSQRMKLFARHALENMDPEFRKVYQDFFKTTEVDALLYGRFGKQSSGQVPLHLEFASLTTGELLGTLEVNIPAKEVPAQVSIEPPGLAKAIFEKTELENLLSSTSSGLTLRVFTDRGAGGVYKNGENLQIHVFVNREAYIKVYHIDVYGKTQLIFPNPYYSNNRVPGGKLITIPDATYPFQFRLGPPYGAEFIKVIASTLPFQDTEKAFSTLPGKSKEAVSRGLQVISQGLEVKPTEEITEALTAYTIVEK
ncbi:MAG: DUF4384 domain-containing protein [Spirochaetales bacterium]